MLRTALDALGVQLDLVPATAPLDGAAIEDEAPAARLLRLSTRIAALERSGARGPSAKELRGLLQEQSRLARQIARQADARRAAVSG